MNQQTEQHAEEMSVRPALAKPPPPRIERREPQLFQTMEELRIQHGNSPAAKDRLCLWGGGLLIGSIVFGVLNLMILFLVLRAADGPVWAGVDELSSLSRRPIRTILCGLSLGPRADFVLRWAADLARQLKATLTVIHSNRSLESMPAYPCDGEWRLWVKRTARDDISALQKAIGTQADVWIEPGPPLEAIPSVAESLRADLLVIGKSPRRRLNGVHTMSYDMVCRALCPVASV